MVLRVPWQAPDTKAPHLAAIPGDTDTRRHQALSRLAWRPSQAIRTRRRQALSRLAWRPSQAAQGLGTGTDVP